MLFFFFWNLRITVMTMSSVFNSDDYSKKEEWRWTRKENRFQVIYRFLFNNMTYLLVIEA